MAAATTEILFGPYEAPDMTAECPEDLSDAEIFKQSHKIASERLKNWHSMGDTESIKKFLHSENKAYGTAHGPDARWTFSDGGLFPIGRLIEHILEVDDEETMKVLIFHLPMESVNALELRPWIFDALIVKLAVLGDLNGYEKILATERSYLKVEDDLIYCFALDHEFNLFEKIFKYPEFCVLLLRTVTSKFAVDGLMVELECMPTDDDERNKYGALLYDERPEIAKIVEARFDNLKLRRPWDRDHVKRCMDFGPKAAFFGNAAAADEAPPAAGDTVQQSS